MWKKDDAKPQGVPDQATGRVNPPPAFNNPAGTPHPSASASLKPAHSLPNSDSVPVSANAAACISQGIKIRGEVTGSEDLFVDGTVDGKLSLTNGSLTIGPNGNVKADVTAREVIVRGRVDGKVSGRDKVQLWSTSQVTGEVQTDRLAIEEGALLRGKVEAGKPSVKPAEPKPAAAAATAGKSAESMPAASGSAAD